MNAQMDSGFVTYLRNSQPVTLLSRTLTVLVLVEFVEDFFISVGIKALPNESDDVLKTV